MLSSKSRVTIHMAASLDGYIARKDGSVDWMETSDGISFFDRLDKDVALHLAEVKAYTSGIVDLHYEVRGRRGG